MFLEPLLSWSAATYLGHGPEFSGPLAAMDTGTTCRAADFPDVTLVCIYSLNKVEAMDRTLVEKVYASLWHLTT